MPKKHSLKSNESLISSRCKQRTGTSTTTTTATLTRFIKSTTNKMSQNKEKQSSVSATTQAGMNRTTIQPVAFTSALQIHNIQSSTKQIDMNLSPILIIISPDIESEKLEDQLNLTKPILDEKNKKEIQDEKVEKDLVRIMDNFITTVTSTNLSDNNDLYSNKKVDDILQNSKLENTKCIDFGIEDYLCKFKTEEDEIEIDISSQSSDTDSNYMDASPPTRFSDSDFESIEPISVTLETNLNSSKIMIHKVENLKPCETIDLIPRRPFRRHISLPPSIFMSRFFGNTNEISPLHSPTKEMTFILRSTRLTKSTAGVGPIHFPKINRLESISSSDMECRVGSSMSCYCTKSNSSWSMSIESNGGSEFEDSVEQESAFTSDIEKRALVLRSMRRLIRQDTTVGNFAPPHFRNT